MVSDQVVVHTVRPGRRGFEVLELEAARQFATTAGALEQFGDVEAVELVGATHSMSWSKKAASPNSSANSAVS